MINKDIYEGLKLALSRKQTLKDAMMSFYNAGYKKEDIEDAARAIQAEQQGAISKPFIPPIKQPAPPVKPLPRRIIADGKPIKTDKEQMQVKFNSVSDKVPIQKNIPLQSSVIKTDTEQMPVKFNSTPNKINSNQIPLKPNTTPLGNQTPITPNISTPLKVNEQKPGLKQNVSEYDEKKPKGKGLVILLIFVFLIFAGILTTVILFKSELVELLKNFIG